MTAAAGPAPSSEAGFSLVEMVITMAILSVVLGGISTLFVQGLRSESDLNQRFQAQQGARNAVDLVRRDGHRACSVTGASGTSVTFVWWNPTANPPDMHRHERHLVHARERQQVGALARQRLLRLWRVRRDDVRRLGHRLEHLHVHRGRRHDGGVVNQHTLAVLKLDIPVNVTSKPLDAYRLVDDVALRNTVRS